MPSAASAVATWPACARASADLRAPSRMGRLRGALAIRSNEALGPDLWRHHGGDGLRVKREELAQRGGVIHGVGLG